MKTAGFVIGLIFSLILFFVSIYILSVEIIINTISGFDIQFIGGFTMLCSILMLIGSSISLKHPSAASYLLVIPAILCIFFASSILNVFPVIMVGIAGCLLISAGKTEKREREYNESTARLYEEMNKKREKRNSEAKNKIDHSKIKLNDMKEKTRIQMEEIGIFKDKIEKYYKSLSAMAFLKEAWKEIKKFQNENPENEEIKELADELYAFLPVEDTGKE